MNYFICYGFLVQAAITHYHRVDSLSNKYLFLTILEAGKSKINVLADLVSGESPFPCLQMAIFLLCHHLVKTERENKLSSYKGSNPTHEGSTLLTLLPSKDLNS